MDTLNRRLAVFGHAQLAAALRAECQALGQPCVWPGARLELRDEWQVRHWIAEFDPAYVLACPEIVDWSLKTFTFGVIGTMNVLQGALGIARRVRLVLLGHPVNRPMFECPWDAPDAVLRQLVHAIQREKKADYGIYASPPEDGMELAAKLALKNLFQDVTRVEKKKAQGQDNSEPS
jgi:hypothetical protein